MDLSALVRDAPVLATMRREMASRGWTLADFDRFVDGLGWGELAPRLDPARIQAHVATNDRFFEVETTRRQIGGWSDDVRWYPTSHLGFIPRLPIAVRRARPLIRGLSR